MPQLIAGALVGLQFGGFSLSPALAGILGNLGASLLLTAASNALIATQGPNQPSLKRDLSLPAEKPPYRFVYGRDLAVGTPAPVRVRDDMIIGCWILNSRPSALTDWTLYLDKREVATTGDPFDFTNGGGATGTTYPFIGSSGAEVLRFWFGRGDQTTVPYEIRTNYPWASGADEELFKTTDVWEGVTVMWALMKAGGSDDRQERWPSTPPLVEVLADWSKVYDPRDGGQDPDDPDTWTYSDNHALCILDAARQNPVKPYQLSNILLSTFEDAADVADELVDLNAGGTEKRYTVSGTIVWQNAELEDQLAPMFAAGAAQPVRVGGKLGIVPGCYITPDYTLTDLLEGGIRWTGVQAGNLPTQLRTRYTSALRLYEEAELEPYDIPGAQTADGGLPSVKDLDLQFAGSPTQAMRVQKIEGARARQQHTLTAVAPPDAFNLIGGSSFTLDLDAPWDRWNGVYRVLEIHPALDLAGDDGVSLRIPFTAVRTSSTAYDWDEATDEQTIENETFDGLIASVPKPIYGVATGGAGQIVVTFDLPATGAFEQIQFWGADVDDVEEAELLNTKSAVAGSTKTYTETGLGTSVTRYYFARSKDSGDRYSGFTASVSDTTDP